MADNLSMPNMVGKAADRLSDHLVLRFRAPIMCFGGVKIDETSPTNLFPTISMVTGLLSNALGLEHQDWESVQRLQSRLKMAARQDVPGKLMVDYQTVDLGSEKMRVPGWTTWGFTEEREGSVKDGTHQMWVHYIVDGSITVVINLARKIEPDDPRLQDIAEALLRPARTLFIGKRSCIPSEPILLGASKGTDVLHVLSKIPYDPRSVADGRILAQWPKHLGHHLEHRLVEIHGIKDWNNRLHLGSVKMRQGYLPIHPAWEDFSWTHRSDINRYFFEGK